MILPSPVPIPVPAQSTQFHHSSPACARAKVQGEHRGVRSHRHIHPTYSVSLIWILAFLLSLFFFWPYGSTRLCISCIAAELTESIVFIIRFLAIYLGSISLLRTRICVCTSNLPTGLVTG